MVKMSTFTVAYIQDIAKILSKACSCMKILHLHIIPNLFYIISLKKEMNSKKVDDNRHQSQGDDNTSANKMNYIQFCIS